MTELLLLALALSMDAFAVSIGLGAKFKHRPLSIAVWSALYFGFFQGAMPLIGYAGGKQLLGWIGNYTAWIAFIILLVIGGKMIYESFQDDHHDDVQKVTHRTMFLLAIATSIDALAAGFTLNLLEINGYFACLIIGLVTFIVSFFAVFIGKKSGTYLESKAELLGGIILVAIGFKLLLA